MYIFLIVVHIFVCFVLISVILLQAGRGGGLSEIASSTQPQSILGTQTNRFMMRATEVCAVLFIVTSISLGILTSSRSKSLVEKTRLSRAVKEAVSSVAAPKEAPKSAVVEPVAAEPDKTNIESVAPVATVENVPAPAPQEETAPAKTGS